MQNFIEKYPYFILFLVWLGVFCFHLNVIDPNIMEARNFITAREMLTDGNWLLTTMDGFPRYEKPPLPTWLVALSGAIFGLDSIWALRLPSALVTLLLMCFLHRFSFKFTENKIYALLATLILGTSFFIVFAGRNGTWDIFAHSFMLCGIYYLYRLFNDKYKFYTNALLSGLYIGLSFMSKGPVSHYALLLPFLIAYGITNEFHVFRKKRLAFTIMLLIIGLLSSWWAYYIYLNDINDATRIAKKESSRWLAYEVKPFYYYWSFFSQSGIWTIPAFISLCYPYLKDKVFYKKGYKLTLLWTIISIVLLSIIPTKKSRYLLPVLIPLALNTAFYVEYLFRISLFKISKWEKLPIYFNSALIATIGILFPLVSYIFFGRKLNDYYVTYLFISIFLFSIGLFMWYHLLKQNFKCVFLGTVVFIIIIMSVGFPLANVITQNPTYNSISKLENSKIPVYALNSLAPELVWKYGKKTKRISSEILESGNIESEFGIITSVSESKNTLLFINDKYHIKYKETFDLNIIDSSKRGYKNRLKADYYIVKKWK